MNPYLSHSYFKTFRDAPADAETISNQLMMRAGLLRKLNPGIFTYTPLMTRAIHKVSQHIREVFDDIHWEECLMPMVIPAELWKETGRWNLFGDQLLRIKDRKSQDFCLGPTHEEVVTDLARYHLSSYKQLPFTLYQIQTKFRDEIRPRFGVMRAREFIMMDGYSFHATTEDLDRHYEDVRAAYCRFFDRLQLKYRVVEADTGAIGGSSSHEFHVLADSGEDLILWCDHCDYASNVERTECFYPDHSANPSNTAAPETVATPGAVAIADVCKILGIKPEQTIKGLILRNPFTDELIGAAVRGDKEVSLTKITAKLGWAGIEPASEAILVQKFGLKAGQYSPNTLTKIRWIIDASIQNGVAYTAASVTFDHHIKNIVAGRDFAVSSADRFDFSTAQTGETCARCKKGHYQANRGIEVGHIFKLGTKYSQSMNLAYLGQDGKSQTPTMGCYGIGVTRVIAACIEQNHDKDGIIFPQSIAPIDLQLVVLAQDQSQVGGSSGKSVSQFVKEVIEFGKKHKLHVAVDNRDLQPGVKFKDADLIGTPFQVVIGKKWAEGQVEFKVRRTGEKSALEIGNVMATLQKTLQQPMSS